MLSQWDCFLKNLGEWQGSFTRLSPQGEFLGDTPTVISFEGLDNNTLVRQVVRYLPANELPQEKVLEYRSLSRSLLFQETGAFSQGAMQWSPVAEFGAEFGLIDGDRRLRFVLFCDRNGQFDRLTLIREKLAASNTPERPPLTLEQLLGEWQGEATTIYLDWHKETYPTHLKLEKLDNQRLQQQLTFGSGSNPYQITSTARIDGSLLNFEQGELPVQVLFLADGSSVTCPPLIKARQPFFLEVGWLLSPTRRQRLIRSYDDKGAWVSLTLVKEEKIRA